VRRLDQRFQDLRQTVRPTVVGLPGPMPQSRRRQLMHAAGIRYWARTLAVRAEKGVAPERIAGVRTHIEQVRQALAHGDRVDFAAEDPPQQPNPVEAAIRDLDEALAALVAERSSAVPETTAVPVG
jgi:hypothetical protein